MGGELLLEHDFPEAIIQRIQSLLTGEEAARTTILSKSWHRAWLTRPNLELNESYFNWYARHEFFPVGGFSKYAKKTIKRYEQSNLKIESFKLCMSIDCYAGAELANKLIVKALRKLGATRLSFQLGGIFDFPCEVVFGSDNLVELTIEGCKLNVDGIVIKCCRLEYLCLDGVDSDTVSKIILSCPLIEKLSLSNVYRREEYDAVAVNPDLILAPDVGEWEAVAVNPDLVLAPAAAPRPAIIDNLDRLKCLVLCYDSFKTLFPGDLLSKFPFLTDFTLNLNGGGDVQISNCSLENIKMKVGKKARRRMERGNRGAEYSRGWWPEDRLKVRLDVPNIQKFTFEGDCIPKLSFVSSPTREWESHVSIEERNGFGGPTVFWFRALNQLLTELRQSKINLSLHVECGVGFDYRVGDLNVTRKHDLESLTIDMAGLPSLSCYALLDGLFRLCHPKLIIPERNTNIDLLWHSLEQGMHVSIPRQFMYGLNDLEEANAQIFDDDDVMGWRPPIPLKSLLLDDIPKQQRVRLLLKWKPS